MVMNLLQCRYAVISSFLKVEEYCAYMINIVLLYLITKVYQSSGDLKKHLDPNLSYGENHNHNTPLHYAAKHGMKHLLR